MGPSLRIGTNKKKRKKKRKNEKGTSREERRKREGSFPRGSDSVDKGEKRKTKKRGKKEKKERKEKKNGGELCVRREGNRYFPGVPTVPFSSACYVQAAKPHLGPQV